MTLAWFDEALRHRGDSHYFDADGTLLHVKTWNWSAGPDTPALLLVHGFLGHAGWWDAVAPAFLPQYRVAALDLSGMGDSGPRPAYSGERFSRDIIAAIHHLDLAPATVIAHSYGGSRAMLATTLDPAAFARIIAMDSFFSLPGEAQMGSPAMQRRVYPDLETALSRYRLMPPQQAAIPEVMRHVARHSLKPFGGGWTWKFDPGMSIVEEDDGLDIVARVRCRTDYVHAECSPLVDAARARRIGEALRFPGSRGPITLPGAQHHLLLDKPLETVALVQRLLAD